MAQSVPKYLPNFARYLQQKFNPHHQVKTINLSKKGRIFLISLISLLLFSIGYINYHHLTTNEIGLYMLSWVKKIKGQSVDVSTIDQTNTVLVDHQIWTDLLCKHVDEAGRVDYEGFIRDSTSFADYLTLLSEHPPGKNWSEAEKLAYWINAYNAFTVRLILDHYPLKSIKDIGDGLPMINSPWDIKFFKIGKTPFDLNTIEHEILRKQFEEPRIHFAINCASFSCPKLRNEAFTAQHLDFQLDDQIRNFLSNPDKNRFTTEKNSLSKIFNWFSSDFTQQTDLLGFIQLYKPDLNRELQMEYMEYNWALNK